MFFKKCFFFSFLLLAVLHFSLFSAINLSNTSVDSVWPAVAVNSAGEIMVVWTEWEGSGKMFYRMFKNGQWSSMKNAQIVSQQAWSNQLEVDSFGTFHASWADGYGSHGRDIYYSYYAGSNWATPERIYYSPYNSAWNKMDIDTNNDIHVVWYHSHVPKGQISSDIVTASKSRMGNWPANYKNISNTPSLESIHPAIAVRNGNIYSCWMEGESPRRLYFCEKAGGSWKTPTQIEQPGYYPDMDIDNSGNVHIAFSKRGGNFYYISRVNGTWNTKEVISNGTSPLQFGDIKHKSNVVVAAWIQGSDGNWSVYTTAKIIGGEWVTPLKVADTPGGSDGNKHVQVALDSNNCAHYVWEGIGVGGKHDVFYETVCVEDPVGTFIEVDKSFLSFTTDGSYNPDPQTFQVRSYGEETMNYSISSDKSWLSAFPQQGTSSGEWDTITVEVDSSSLSDGTYYGKITVTAPDAYNSPVEISVSLSIGEETNPSFIEVDKLTLEFSASQGNNPSPQTFQIRSYGEETLNYSISSDKSWLSVSPQQGTSSGEWDTITVEIDSADFVASTRSGKITITAPDASNSPVKISVFLTVEEKTEPYIQLNRSSFYFSAFAGGDNPDSQTFRIKNSGGKTLNYQISTTKNWLKVSPTQGSSTGEWDTITVSVDVSSLGINMYDGIIKIEASGAGNSPQRINVEFGVVLPPYPYSPTNVQLRRTDHEGLMMKDYISRIDWQKNSKNDGLFNIVNYRIFRKKNSEPISAYAFVDDVGSNVFNYYDQGFSSKSERDMYCYAVTCIDDAGRESIKAETSGGTKIPLVDSLEKITNKKESYLIKDM